MNKNILFSENLKTIKHIEVIWYYFVILELEKLYFYSLVQRTQSKGWHLLVLQQGERAWGSPLGDEVYKVWGESVGGQLWRRLVHYLFELLERGAPGLVGEFQNGQLNLRVGKREK